MAQYVASSDDRKGSEKGRFSYLKRKVIFQNATLYVTLFCHNLPISVALLAEFVSPLLSLQ